MEDAVIQHYSVDDLEAVILGALRVLGKDPAQLKPADLAPVDEFHVRGVQATEELRTLVDIDADSRVLDLGCGLGGSCRYLASKCVCHVTGIDLTDAYCEAATRLSRHVGLSKQTTFRQGNACDLPFDDGEFDVVWTEHAQMNIEDKVSFYGEAHRVLRSGGHLLFHDIFRGGEDEVHYPVPWAENGSISHLWTTDEIRTLLVDLGLHERHWEDKSHESALWFRGVVDRIRRDGPPPLGIHLLMGKSAALKLENITRNLEQGRIVVVQAVFTKPELPSSPLKNCFRGESPRFQGQYFRRNAVV
ncbi:MAG: methyltransferase domain-containing protein, partial [Planctomycetes bacterium]|nr:methyltransferase domain-containing protein [Planctomycetota bacterium]